MRIYNYVRPLWSNGVHVVHDVPDDVLSALKGHFGPGSTARLASDDVQVARLESTGVTFAWILLEIELPTAETDFSYRRARYLHVIVSKDPAWRELDVQSARTLFTAVYGEDIRHGIGAGQVVLQRLDYPRDAGEARDLFVGTGHEPVAEARSNAAATSGRPRRPDPAVVALPTPAPTSPTPLPAPPRPPAPIPEPAWVTIDQPTHRPSNDPVGFDPDDAMEAAETPPAPPASLAALLHGRLSDEFPRDEEVMSRRWPALAEDSGRFDWPRGDGTP